MFDSRLPGALHHVIQERLIRINCVNNRAEFLRQRYCLATCPTTCVNDDVKLLRRKKAQHMQSMDIAPWAKLFHSPKEKVNRIAAIQDCSIVCRLN
jgi:hypothetical protein